MESNQQSRHNKFQKIPSSVAVVYHTSGEESAQFQTQDGHSYIVRNGTFRRVTRKSKGKKNRKH